MSGQGHALATLYHGKNPSTHWIGGWVGLRAGLDTEARGKPFASEGGLTPAILSVVTQCTELGAVP
jgi:hypothetical protein